MARIELVINEFGWRCRFMAKSFVLYCCLVRPQIRMYSVEKVYSVMGEFQFEEIFAARWRKKKREEQEREEENRRAQSELWTDAQHWATTVREARDPNLFFALLELFFYLSVFVT